MTTTTESAEQLALRGLLLLVVEVQNIVRRIGVTAEEIDGFAGIEQIEDLVESDHAREIVQLTRAVLDYPLVTVPSVIPAAAAGIHE